MRSILRIALLLAVPLLSFSQTPDEYPADYLSPAFHAGRRTAFREKMPDKSVAIFFAAPQKVRNNDVNYIYAQNKNFYYLTGLEEPNAVLLLFKQNKPKLPNISLLCNCKINKKMENIVFIIY